jgi:hypothetical protein
VPTFRMDKMLTDIAGSGSLPGACHATETQPIPKNLVPIYSGVNKMYSSIEYDGKITN